MFHCWRLYLAISAVSCDPSTKLRKQENEEIQNYLSQNSNLNFVKQPSGLYYLEVVPGTGTVPVVGDSAYVKYTGKFLDGTIFDSNVSTGTLYGFIVGLNITGFDEGITLMKAGGKSTFLFLPILPMVQQAHIAFQDLRHYCLMLSWLRYLHIQVNRVIEVQRQRVFRLDPADFSSIRRFSLI